MPTARQVTLPLSRQIELVDILGLPGNRARRVSRVLAAVLGIPLGEARRMSISARAQALVEIALLFGRWPAWFVLTCRSCGAKADVSVSGEDFTASPERWPAAVQEHQVGDIALRFSALDGRHEEILARGGPVTAARILRLALPCSHRAMAAAPLERIDASGAEAIVDALAPEAVDPPGVVPLHCPACLAPVSFHFDALDWISRHLGGRLREVATLARAFGWSEREVCALGPHRRAAYLRSAAEWVA